jgi:hypothetical protein
MPRAIRLSKAQQPESLTQEAIAAIAARAEAATFGPWKWYGTPKEPYLATTTGGRIYILMPCRSRMNSASFMLRGLDGCGMQRAEVYAVKERDYRDDLDYIAHPDAEFLAHAREDIPALIATVALLQSKVDALEAMDVASTHDSDGWERDLKWRSGYDAAVARVHRILSSIEGGNANDA